MATYKLNTTLETTLTVGELRDLLEDYDQDAPVLFACEYGDCGNTIQALGVMDTEERSTNDLSESCYSQSGVALNEAEQCETYCAACDDQYGAMLSKCPKCDGEMVDEDGDVVKPNNELDEDAPSSVCVLHFDTNNMD